MATPNKQNLRLHYRRPQNKVTSRWRLFSLMLIFSMAEASGTAVVTPNAVVVLPRTPDWSQDRSPAQFPPVASTRTHLDASPVKEGALSSQQSDWLILLLPDWGTQDFVPSLSPSPLPPLGQCFSWMRCDREEQEVAGERLGSARGREALME
ncbi:hypothetical protein EYF80_027758 [Liparis tanakae]|uniref:Uncharacterized protein n=1 Tax=Liparis tanakae TaxID=230148 RepID=A0A4Z2H919_9TELE|nr:hypothetical protein EYF80_027758 [Liparis tanakae]